MQRFHLAMVDSTNDWAKRNLNTMKIDQLTLITADAQSAGRGSFSKKWYSPEHQNIYATFILFQPHQEVDRANFVQLLAKVCQTLLQNKGLKAEIKWPNDLLIDKKKLAGILIETMPYGDLLAIIMGIGINVNMPKEEINKLDQKATSLLLETNTFWDKDILINELFIQLQKELNLKLGINLQ